MFRFPDAAPPPKFLPMPRGCVQRCCHTCDVMWKGPVGDECWCCGGPGETGKIKVRNRHQ